MTDPQQPVLEEAQAGRCGHQRIEIEESIRSYLFWRVDRTQKTCDSSFIEGIPAQGVKIICMQCGESWYRDRYKPGLPPHIQEALDLIELARDRPNLPQEELDSAQTSTG